MSAYEEGGCGFDQSKCDVLRVDERISDSHIGRDNFFCGFTFDFFKFNIFPWLKGRQNTLSNNKNLKNMKKVIDF